MALPGGLAPQAAFQKNTVQFFTGDLSVSTKLHPTFSTAAHWIWGGETHDPGLKNDWRYFRTGTDLPLTSPAPRS
jgi:hypothetical protein